jgi:hypothetical protein
MVRESYSTVCGALAARRSPNIVSVTTGKEGPKQIATTAMLFPTAVARVQIEREKAAPISVRPRLVPQARLREAGVRKLRFGTFVSEGPLCFGRIVEFNAAGDRIFEAPPEPCFEE